MKASLRIAALAVSALTVASWAGAHDAWDLNAGFCNDDVSSAVCNQLLHGVEQRHDMQAVSPARDLDWYIVETKARHSYEVRVFGTSNLLQTGSTTGFGTRVNRVDATGTVLTAPVVPDGTIHYADGASNLAVRWVGGGAAQRDFIRVEGNDFSNPNDFDEYSIVFFDTTVFIPRFNNAGGQVTVLLIQNASPAVVTGSIFFYSSAGALLHTEPLAVAVQGLQVVATSGLAPLAGLSGSVVIAHTGGFGAIAAKSVALEPSTGFSFDTPGTTLPH